MQEAVERLFRLQFGGSRPETRPDAVQQLSGMRHGQYVSSSTGRSGRVVAVAAAAAVADSAEEELWEQGMRLAAGGPAVWGGGAVWALDVLLEPVAMRFRFHFEEERPTNRTDREF